MSVNPHSADALESLLSAPFPSLEDMRARDAVTPCSGRSILSDLLKQMPNGSSPFLLSVAEAKLRVGDVVGAADDSVKALERAFSDGRTDLIAEAWYLGAKALVLQGSFNAARAVIDQLASAARGSNSTEIAARDAEISGWLLLRNGSLQTGEFEDSFQSFQESLAFYTELKDSVGQIRALDGLANAASALGEYIQSLEFVDRGLKICAEKDGWRLTHRLLMARAFALRDLGYRQPAEQAFETAIAWCDFEGDGISKARALMGLGTLYGYDLPRRLKESVETIRDAIRLADHHRAMTLAMEARLFLAEVHGKVGDRRSEMSRKEEAARIADKMAFEGASRLYAMREEERKVVDQERRDRFVARVRGAIESSLDAVLILDPLRQADGSIIDFLNEFRNSAADRLLETTPSVARHWSVIRRLPVFEGLDDTIVNIVKGGGEYEDEVERNGRWYARRLVGIGDSVAISARDITDRYASQIALRQSLERADAANQAKSEFLASMSHEIRTPLNGVLGMARLLQETELDASQREYVEAITGSADVLMTIIGDVLDLSKIEAGQIEFRPGPVDLRHIADETVRLFTLQAHAQGVDLVAEVAPEVPEQVLLDGGRVRQVLTNLVGNALKFTEEGGVRIAISARTGELLFAVEDSGIGIPEDCLEAIFDPFVQARPDDAQSGLGLGLTISKRLVSRMGGEIAAEQRKSGGSRLWFVLPLVTSSAGDATVSPLPDIAGLQVLVAEDNAVNALLARTHLERLGCIVEVVPDGAPAVERVLAGACDVVLMDIRMPGMDGLEASRQIRQNETGRRTPIVALTANALRHEREEAFEAGMDEFITKPFEVGALRLVLARIVGRG